MDFGELYALYFRDVFLYLLSLSASQDEAEEITQETFFKALKKTWSSPPRCALRGQWPTKT